MRVALLFIALFAFSFVSHASPLSFNGFIIDRDNAQATDQDDFRSQVTYAPLPATTKHYLLASQPGRASELQASLLRSGVTPDYVISGGGFLVTVRNDSERESLLRSKEMDFAVPFRAEFKIDASFNSTGDTSKTPFIVHLFPGASADETQKKLDTISSSTSVEIAGESDLRIGVRCSTDEAREIVSRIAEIDDVFFIERDHGVQLMNMYAVRILQSGQTNGTATIFSKGLYGQNQIAAICDTGIDPDSCFFRNTNGSLPPTNTSYGTAVNLTQRKVVAVDFLYSGDNPTSPTDWDNHGHGTAVAGCIAGSAISNPTSNTIYNGIAPLAKLVVQDGGFTTDDCADLPGLGCPVIDLTPLFQQAYDQGARFHSNSWGDRENFLPHNTYTSRCRDIDLFAWTHKDFLVLCAAGNEGAVAGAVSSPGVAKNALSVGGTGNQSQADQIISFSSRGPASDGRIKPDLVAPASVTSALSDRNILTNNCGQAATQGTSFSTPLTTGAACLVREYLQEGFYPGGVKSGNSGIQNPSSALIKAMLINSCVSVPLAAQPIPAPDQGWGRTALDNALYFQGDTRRLFLHDEHGGFSASGTPDFQASIQVHASQEPLKVTLVWTDYPATLGSQIHLVNDLNLSVHRNGEEYRGNVFSNGFSVTGGDWDAINNVEQVLIQNPPVGVYEISVIPLDIREPSQDFALVVTGDIRTPMPSSATYWSTY